MGILKARGAYLPLDPGYPAERLSFMLADAGVAVLVSQSGLLERLGERLGDVAGLDAARRPMVRPVARQLVRLDADWPAIARQPSRAPALTLDPRHPAYVIYTSGSTGTPKGVVVEHASLANKVLTLGHDFGVGTDFDPRFSFPVRLTPRSSRPCCRSLAVGRWLSSATTSGSRPRNSGSR